MDSVSLAFQYFCFKIKMRGFIVSSLTSTLLEVGTEEGMEDVHGRSSLYFSPSQGVHRKLTHVKVVSLNYMSPSQCRCCVLAPVKVVFEILAHLKVVVVY